MTIDDQARGPAMSAESGARTASRHAFLAGTGVTAVAGLVGGPLAGTAGAAQLSRASGNFAPVPKRAPGLPTSPSRSPGPYPNHSEGA